jgi:hypothetical protein
MFTIPSADAHLQETGVRSQSEVLQSVSLQSAASLQGVDGRESTVESAKGTVQYGNRRGTRESTEGAIVNTVSVRTACNRTIVIPTV